MKKIILIFILPLTLLMAEMTLTGTQLSITDITQTPDTDSPDADSPDAGTSKTNWGFQPFTVPSNSVTVPAGGNIQAAINSLSNGGTVNLEEGIYYGDRIRLKSNIVLQGAGTNKTTIKFQGVATHALITAHAGSVSNGLTNMILRDFKADCSATDNANGIEFIYGVGNVLVENVDVFGAAKSNLIVYNSSWSVSSRNVTFKNINSHNARGHGLAMRYVKGAIIENSHSHDNPSGHGLDLSRVQYGEVSHVTVDNCGYGGSKYPSSDYIYIHDSIFTNCKTAGIWLQWGEDPPGRQHKHLENITVNNCDWGIVDFSNKHPNPPTHEEIVVIGVVLTNNMQAGVLRDKIRVKGCNNAHEYGNNIGITQASEGTVNAIHHSTGTPEGDNVGWTSWPGI